MQAYRIFIADLYRTFGWALYLVIAWMTVVGVTEGLTMVLLLPLLGRLGIAGRVAPTQITRVFDAFFAMIAPNAGITLVLVVLIIVAIIQFALSLGLNWYMSIMTRRYAMLWQIRLFSAIMKAEWTFITEHKSGEFTNAITVETGRVTAGLQGLLLLASSAIVTAIYLGFAVLVSWQATVLLIFAAIIMGLSVLQLYKMSHAVGGQLAPLGASLQVLVNEYFASVKVIKATSSEDRAIARVTGVLASLSAYSAPSCFFRSSCG